MLRNTIDSLEYTIKSCESLLGKEEALLESQQEIEVNIARCEERLLFLKGAKDKYTIAVN